MKRKLTLETSGTFRLTVKRIEKPFTDFKFIYFTGDHGIKYQPGQYLTFIFTRRGEEVRRSYSICSVPGEDLAIGVKRKTNGTISRLLVDDIEAGDILTTAGAGGFFLPPSSEKEYKRIFFFAAGSGITPILPLIKTSLSGNNKVLLVYSNTSVENTIFYHELNTLAVRYSNQFRIEYLFSNAKNILRSRLERSLLLELLQRYGKNNCLYYLCGPELYMLKIHFILIEQGVEKENIRKENFVIHAKNLSQHLPTDRAAHKVTISFGSEKKSFIVNFPDTILRAAKRNGLALPYSCETGSCGNCAAICRSGEVWLSHNEVLMESDLKNGMVLTCTGHPVNGDIELTYQQ